MYATASTAEAGVTYRKMFGKYLVYINEKPILLVCDNTVFVKKLPETAELMRDCSEEYPYDGARAHYIPHIENRDLLYKAVTALERITPVPKRRKKRPDSEGSDFRAHKENSAIDNNSEC